MADALGGARGNAFMQQAAARGIQAAGENPSGGGGASMAFLGMGMGAAGGAVQGLQQPPYPQGQPQGGYQQVPPQQPSPYAPPAGGQQPQGGGDDPVARLTQLKTMLDAGLITQEDYDAAKASILGF